MLLNLSIIKLILMAEDEKAEKSAGDESDAYLAEAQKLREEVKNASYEI